MEVFDNSIQILRAQIQSTENQLNQLKRQLEEAERRKEEGSAKDEEQQSPAIPLSNSPSQANGHWPWPLQPDEYKRYGRQMILQEIGLQGLSLSLCCDSPRLALTYVLPLLQASYSSNNPRF